MPDSSEPSSGELFAARAEAFQRARTINLLKTFLLFAVVVGLVGLVVYILNYTIVKAPVREPFDNKQAYVKIVELEKQLQVLKLEIAPVKSTNGLVAGFQTIMRAAVTYWALLAFVFAVGIAVYVKIKFKIDYFESYRDLATKKMLSDFYRELGDRMLATAEWEAAEEAYRNSLAINPTNIKATHGIAKATVLQPLKGQQFYGPDLADYKLDYLIDHSVGNSDPQDRRRDTAELYFLKSINRSSNADDVGSRTWLNKAIATDPSYFAPYLNLGVSYHEVGDFQKAIECYERAAKLEPTFALSYHNLGTCYLNTAQFGRAVEYFIQANTLVPTVLTHLALGEAYRFAGQLLDAVELHKLAASNLELPEIEKERYATGSMIWNFMPVSEGDTESSKRSVKVTTLAQKKMLAQFALAFDRGALGEFKRANARFESGRAADPEREYNSFFINRIDSIVYFLRPEQKIADWFGQMKKEFSDTAA